ncbi:choice-of-anchor P family protein [Nocardioides aquiterrae]|uniref:choice-of-anchor P family protein n=1 Tax=Nocardioides aquiterrae TaxID=203799 RepID=UPI0031D56F10
MTTTVVALATTSALSIAGLGAAQAATTGSAGSVERAAGRDAGFALKAAGYGTRASGGQVPAGSRDTAFMAIGCGTKVGMERENHEAEATLPGGAGTASAIRTDLWTVRSKDGGVHSYSRNRTAKIVLAQSGLGEVQISAVTSLSHAWHDGQGFHAETKVTVGDIEFVPPSGDPQHFEIPTPGQPIEIPGLAKITVGQSKKSVTSAGATAEANALRVTFLPSATRLTVGHSAAQALDGIKHGTFHGFSTGTRSTAADDSITSGRTPLSLLPCQGTNGKLRTKAIADVNLGDQIVVQGLRSQQKASQFPGKSVAMERGTVASINLGDGQLVVDGIIGQANVTRSGSGGVTSDIKGTTLGTITANGEPQSFPDSDVIEIPGVAKLERNIVDKTKFGISVISLRITLLDGRAAVIDLGVAQARIR